MPLHLVPLALTVLAVVVLGIVAIICSTSGGADWLQTLWQRNAAAPGADDADHGRATRTTDGSGANALAGAADALGNAFEGGYRADGTHEGRLPGHAVDDA